jgi:hypothetical protein
LRKLSQRPPRRALPAIVAAVAVVASVIGFAGVARADTTYELHARHSGKCMDVAHRSLADKAAVIQYSCNQQSNQEWRFVPVAVSGGVQYYRKCLRVEGGSQADLAQVEQFACNPEAHDQQWQLVND